MLKCLKNRRAEGYVDVIVMVFVVVLFLSLTVNVVPVFIARSQLNTFAAELIRKAEIAGRVGTETTTRTNQLRSNLGIDPHIAWSRTGNIQINSEVTVTLTLHHDIGFFNFGSFPITLTARATGRSEVFWR